MWNIDYSYNLAFVAALINDKPNLITSKHNYNFCLFLNLYNANLLYLVLIYQLK